MVVVEFGIEPETVENGDDGIGIDLDAEEGFQPAKP